MKQLFLLLHDILQQGQPAMLVKVVDSHGSAPGGLGAAMLVDKTGRRTGTIGGGAVEHYAEQLAAQALAEGRSTTKGYTLRHGGEGDIGMVCGGDVTVHFCYVAPSPDAMAFALRAAGAFDKEENAWLLLELGENACHLGLYTRAGGLHTLDCGAPGHMAALAPDELERLLASQGVLREFDGVEYYGEPLVRAGRAVVFGGGHVAQALVPVLSSIGFRTVVYDDRPEFANAALFPTADEIVAAAFDDVENHIALTENDWLVILTRGHAADFDVQKQLLHRRFAYVGVIGSAAKTKSVNARLRAAGIAEEAIQSVHTPIGLDIGAVTPAEIAVSIAGEMIKLRATKNREG